MKDERGRGQDGDVAKISLATLSHTRLPRYYRFHPCTLVRFTYPRVNVVFFFPLRELFLLLRVVMPWFKIMALLAKRSAGEIHDLHPCVLDFFSVPNFRCFLPFSRRFNFAIIFFYLIDCFRSKLQLSAKTKCI